MTRNAVRWRRRALAAMRDPWVLLSAGSGVVVAWAIGIPPALDVTTAAVMLASATGISIFVGSDGDAAGFDDHDDAAPRLRSGTRQAQLVAVLEGYLADLRKMHGSKL